MAAPVAKQLHLDVACVFNELFQEQACVLEVGLRQTRDRVISRIQLGLVAHQAHADAAAACGAFEHYGVANAQGLRTRIHGILEQIAAWQQRHLMLLGQVARRVLEAKGPHLLGAGANEGDACVFTGLCKSRVF